MLERMRGILERIDELHTKFRGMAPRRGRREGSQFAAALNQAKAAATAEPRPATLLATAPPLATPHAAALKPTDFSVLIEKHARDQKLDPALVARLIEVESGSNPRAVSSKGAMGLMQLMPKTAEHLGVEDPFDPDQNISAGTRYLAQLLNQNGGDMQRALAAYNAGPGTVGRFGGVPPFPETRQFISQVLAKTSKP